MLVLATLPSDDNRLRLTAVLRLLLVVMMLMLMVVTEISGGGDGDGGGCLPGWCRHLLSIDNTGPL